MIQPPPALKPVKFPLIAPVSVNADGDDLLATAGKANASPANAVLTNALSRADTD
jgi:hypothetical protein